MSMKTLKKALKKARGVDTFEVGTVIRWTASGRYTYCAIKTDVGWYTTAQSYNTYVDGRYSNLKGLLEMLAKNEVTDVAVSTEWTSV